MKLFTLAWRNIWRNKRRSVVTIAAMSLALFAMVQYSGFMRGYQIDLENSAVAVEMGNIQIHAADYPSNPSLYKLLNHPNELVRRIEAENAACDASARLLGSGLVASEHNSAAAQFRGIDVHNDKRVSDIYKRIKFGKWLSPDAPGGVVIGEQLARILGVKVGDELVFLSQAYDGSTANSLFTVRGIIANAGSSVDRAGVFINRHALADFFSMENTAHQIIVRNRSDRPDSTIAARIRKITSGASVQTWTEIAPELASMIKYMGSALFFMYIIVYIAIGIVVLNAMLMAVFERISEFGVLKAIGVGPLGVFRIILTETFLMLCCSIVGAATFSVPIGYWLATRGIDFSKQMDSVSVSGVGVNPIMKAVFDAHTVAAPVVVMSIIVFVAVLYPGLKAALIQPVNAIRHQ
ncbi:MAG: ABC transporter permease [Deltaproteobacteria bacterium]|nr:ABC transporter permease [Deltaproteobacteria bacterium]MBN2672638.1 ABC transporter permease [Deltaproteobacteria bacterium]